MRYIICLLLATGLVATASAQKKNVTPPNKQKPSPVNVAERKITIEGNEVYEGDRKLGTFTEQFARDDDRTRTVLFYSPDGLRLAMFTMKGIAPKEMDVLIFKTNRKSTIKLTSDLNISPPGLANYLAKEKVF